MKLHQLITALALLVSLQLPRLLSESTAVAGYLSSLLFEHNFHTVVEDRFYRSAAASAEDLPRLLRRHGIRTVINLTRGGDGFTDPSQSERALVEAAGAEYFEVPLNGSRLPSSPRLLPLLDLYERVTPPILVHCRSGTHRSGLAAALWLLEQEGASFETAREQLTMRYGFFHAERRLKSLISGQPTIDQVLWKYGEAADGQPLSFRDWAQRVLPPYNAADSLQNACPLLPAALPAGQSPQG